MAFGLSIAGDVLGFPMALEDGAKYVGLAAAAGWAVSTSLLWIDRPALLLPVPQLEDRVVLKGPDIS